MINSRASTDQHVALSTCGIVATGRSLAGPARSGAIQGAPSVRGPTAVFNTGMRPAFGWLADLGGRWAVGRPGGWSSRAYPASGLPENHDFECDGDLRSRAMPDLPGEEESADSDVYPRDPELRATTSTSDAAAAVSAALCGVRCGYRPARTLTWRASQSRRRPGGPGGQAPNWHGRSLEVRRGGSREE